MKKGILKWDKTDTLSVKDGDDEEINNEDPIQHTWASKSTEPVEFNNDRTIDKISSFNSKFLENKNQETISNDFIYDNVKAVESTVIVTAEGGNNLDDDMSGTSTIKNSPNARRHNTIDIPNVEVVEPLLNDSLNISAQTMIIVDASDHDKSHDENKS